MKTDVRPVVKYSCIKKNPTNQPTNETTNETTNMLSPLILRDKLQSTLDHAGLEKLHIGITSGTLSVDDTCGKLFMMFNGIEVGSQGITEDEYPIVKDLVKKALEKYKPELLALKEKIKAHIDLLRVQAEAKERLHIVANVDKSQAGEKFPPPYYSVLGNTGCPLMLYLSKGLEVDDYAKVSINIGEGGGVTVLNDIGIEDLSLELGTLTDRLEDIKKVRVALREYLDAKNKAVRTSNQVTALRSEFTRCSI